MLQPAHRTTAKLPDSYHLGDDPNSASLHALQSTETPLAVNTWKLQHILRKSKVCLLVSLNLTQTLSLLT